MFAVATNTTALLPAALVAAISDRSQLPRVNRAFVLMMLASFVSAGCGAVLLLLTPARIFELLIPLLLGLGTMLFAYAPRIGAWLRAVQLPRGRGGLSPEVLSIGMIVPVSVYAGYFGAGVGVLLLAAIAIATGGDYRASNVAKNLIGVTSAALSFSHGANDAQKSVGVIAALLLADGRINSLSAPTWVIVACSAALTAGTSLGGWRIIRTVGRRIYRIHPLEGLSSQTSSAGVILGASLLGAPVSTSQVVASSVVGIGAGRRRLRHVNWELVRQIGLAWLITLPASAALAAGLFGLVRLLT